MVEVESRGIENAVFLKEGRLSDTTRNVFFFDNYKVLQDFSRLRHPKGIYVHDANN